MKRVRVVIEVDTLLERKDFNAVLMRNLHTIDPFGADNVVFLSTEAVEDATVLDTRERG